MACTNIEELPDRIGDTFKNRDIFITGGTGFLGKVLIEKFLRCLPEISQLYLLIRPKKGKDPKSRLDDIFDSAVSFYHSLIFTYISYNV
jgi:fatty acyl-CoA reductase